MQEPYCIAAFRSRQQVMAFEGRLNRHGVRTQIVTTPRRLALGCGLSVAFAGSELPRVQAEVRTAAPEGLIGLYRTWRDAAGRTDVQPCGR